jgi:L-seryl-tRNA(Ser) seleniumtransferase
MNEKHIKSKRDFPAVEILASEKEIAAASRYLARPLTVEIIRRTVEKFKTGMDKSSKTVNYSDLVRDIIVEIRQFDAMRIGRVINGTGILVHTNLGRAPLSPELYDTIKGQITGYGNVEFDVTSGKRGQRGILAEKYLAMISGAEAGTIVNNNAGALFVILNTLAHRNKVLISRGELVQIGGGFRIPDIMKKAGARLLEIGTSNVTTRDDYIRALDEHPVAILKVHRSNFSVTGFSDEVDIKSLVDIGHKAGIPVINDLGSGVFINTGEMIGHREPSVQSSVKDGADITCFSGDKLLGGVQAGLIVGQKALITKIKKNPIFRALRVDKTVFSALEILLGHYLDGTWKENIKLWRLASRSQNELLKLAGQAADKCGAGDTIKVEKSAGQMGGGSLPERPIASAALAFSSQIPAIKIAELFRNHQPPVIGRIKDDKFMIDLRAIDNDEINALIRAIKAVIRRLK